MNELPDIADLIDGSPRARSDAYGRIAEALRPHAPSGALRTRLLEAASPRGRRYRFAGRVATLLDLPEAEARLLLDALDDPAQWEDPGIAGVRFFWVPGGPRVAGCVRGFVRVQSGVRFPEHEHVGDERVLVLEGSYRDSVTGERVGSGTLIHGAPGASHALDVVPDGPDLLQLSVIETAVLVGGERIEPR